MDDLEEFLNVFFQECDERLGELQDNLAAMIDGDWDAETLNAAFRAVHSVKGGAGAFALDELVEFTHIFETTMDALRSDRLEPTPQVCQVLLRASDMMSVLIEAAQGNGEADREKADRIMAELEALAEGRDPNELADAPKEAGAAADAAPSNETEEAQTAEEADTDGAEGEGRLVGIRIQPGPDFVRSGHDPLKLIRALKKFGDVTVEAMGDFPELDEHEPIEIPLSWALTLRTETPLDEIENYCMIYTMTADIEISELSANGDEQAPAAEPEAADVAEPEPAADPEPVDMAAPEPQETAEAEAVEAAEDKAADTSDDEPASQPSPAAAEADEAAAEAPAAAQEAKEQPKEDAPQKEGGAGRGAPASAQQQRVAKALRVELNRIDRLVNMVGEIVITQAVLSQNFSELESATDIEFSHAVESLSRQVRELQESVMAIRAQPVKSVFSRMPRIVRDLCMSLNKEARLVLSGEHTEVDTTVIEELAEPLTHMLRNSMDHGVEAPEKREAAGKPREGTINLSAEHRGERVRIIIEDDGAGINREKVLEKAIKNGIVAPDATLTDEEIDMLIFHPGFSTAAQVTNVSGRGVGMDVVKKKVQALGGRVSVSNAPGKGARFTITLPLTLAVLDGMTVGVGQERFILPLGSIVEAVKLDEKNVDLLPGEVRVLRYRGDWLPTICLRLALNLDIQPGKEDLVVVVETETDGRVAIVVDELLGQRQVVLKSLEANFKRVDGVSGATILGDGRVALILDIPALQAMAGGGLGSSQMLQEFTL